MSMLFLHSSHPLFPPLCPQVRWLCLCLHPFPANRFNNTIFLDSIYIYVLIYNTCFSVSDLLHSVWQSLGSSTSLELSRICFPNMSWAVVRSFWWNDTFLFLKKYLFLHLTSLGLSYSTQDLWYSEWSVGSSSWPVIKPRPPALGPQTLTHRTTREVPRWYFPSWKFNYKLSLILFVTCEHSALAWC